MKKYNKVKENKGEWFSKIALLEIYQGLNKHSLNRFLAEMRNSKDFKNGVVNPTHKLVFINLKVFEDFLYWKQHGYSRKIKAK